MTSQFLMVDCLALFACGQVVMAGVLGLYFLDRPQQR